MIRRGGFEGSGFQESNSQGPSINMLTHTEDWEAWNSFGSDPHRRVLVGETSSAGMQTVQRIKRQNCGNNVPGHHNFICGSRDQIGSSFAVANGEADGTMSHSPRTMPAGFHGLADQGNRKVHDSNFQSGPIEVGSSSSSGFPSHVGSFLSSPGDSLHYRASGSVGSFTSSSYPQSCTGSRSSCKRKSSMDDVIGSVGSLTFRPFIERRESDFSRFTEEAGTSRADSRDSNMMYQSLRPRLSHHLQIGNNRFYGGHLNGPQELCQAPYVQNNRVSSDSFPSHIWMSGGTRSHERTMQPARSLHEFSPFNQGNASSAVAPWCGNVAVPVESVNHPNLHRDYSAGPTMGSHARNFSNGASIWMGVPPWMQNTYEPSSSVSSGLPYRESSSQGSHMAPVRHMHSRSVASSQPPPAPLTGHPSLYSQGLLPYPPASRAATGSIILGSQATPGNAYPSSEFLNRSAMPPPLLGSAESGRASPIHNFYGMPFQRFEILPAERGGGPPRLPSHEIYDHAFIYNGFDVYDQHLGLQQPDVDNMSYEELLALEERIGNVNTGLSGENICKCLKTSKYSTYDVTKSVVSQESEIKCSICQEEYMEGDEIGQLDCSHGYHTACIKQWLVLKNQCPICKAAALSLP